MKRLNAQTVANRLEKRLVLNRETLRRLGAEDLEHAAGGTGWLTCTTCTVTRQAFNSGE
jgi:hypothetical protein